MNVKYLNPGLGRLVLLVAAWLMLSPDRRALASIDLSDPGSDSGTDAVLAGTTNAESARLPENTGTATQVEATGVVASTNFTLAANTPVSHESTIILSEDESRNISSLERLNKNADLSRTSNQPVGISASDSLLQPSSGPKTAPSATLLTSPNSVGGILYYDEPAAPQ